MELDYSKKLEVKINNTKPVVLTELTISLLAFSEQFHKFIESETTEDQNIGSKLYVKEVKSGSIIFELVAQVATILPLIWEGGTLVEWTKQVKNITDWLLGKLKSPPKELTKHDLKQWHSIVEPIANDSASQMNICVSDNGKVIQQFIINSQEANAIQNKIKRQIEEMESPDDHIHRKKVMYWYQTKFDVESHTGDKAIIENISPRVKKVVFENNTVKEAILSGDKRFSKPWHKLAYIVDVEVQTVNDEPKVYTILRYYPEHTFDPEEIS